MEDKKDTLEASELVRNLMDPSPSEVFVLHRYNADGELEKHRIRVKKLRVDEAHDAIVAAQKYAKGRGELDGYGDVYREGQAVEVLLRALCRPDIREVNGRKRLDRLFVDAAQLRNAFDETELVQCLNMHELVKAKYGAIEDFSEEELDQYVDRLADGMKGPYFLSLLDSRQWPLLIFALARLARSLLLQTDPTHFDSQTTSVSESKTSQSGTSSSLELPFAQSEAGGETLPRNSSIDSSKARETAKKNRKKD